MLVTPAPGANRTNLLDTLTRLHMGVSNVRNGSAGQTPLQMRYAYLDWADTASRALRNQVAGEDVTRLVRNGPFDLLMRVDDQSALLVLVKQELDERIGAFQAAIDALRTEMARWSASWRLVVADTSVYLTHDSKLDELDFWTELGEHAKPIHLIVPIAVVDELDIQKNRGDKWPKWRAGYSLAVLYRIFTAAPRGVLRGFDTTVMERSGLPRSEITVEQLMDPPGHHRLPITDDEIVARARAVQTLAGQVVTLMTYDTGQALRATEAGLDVVHLTEALGDEPTRPGTGLRAERRNGVTEQRTRSEEPARTP